MYLFRNLYRTCRTLSESGTGTSINICIGTVNIYKLMQTCTSSGTSTKTDLTPGTNSALYCIIADEGLVMFLSLNLQQYRTYPTPVTEPEPASVANVNVSK